MHNILVTGGAGNIGSALVAKLATESETKVVVADNLSTGNLEKVPLAKNVKFVKCDVNDYNDISPLFFYHKFDYVFHYSAVVGVERTIKNPMMVLNDIKGVENVLKLSKNTGVKRFFYSSSSEVYGEPVEIPQYENTTPLNSKLPYAIVKNLAEASCRAYHQEYGLNYTIFRFFNTYGPNQSEDFVVPRFLKMAMRGENITIYGNGSQTRTFCYVDDNIDSCVAALKNDEFINDVVNIGSDREITILKLAQTIIKLTKSDSQIKYLPPLKEGDMNRRCPDISKMKNLLHRPLVPLEEGIVKLIDFYKKKGFSQE